MSLSQAALRRLSCAYALVAVAACDAEDAQPNPAESVFALQTLNETALPYDHEGLGCCVYLSGDLTLGRGRYSMSLTARNRNSGLVFTAREWGKFTQQLSALTFALDSFAVAPLGLDVGTLEANGIRVLFGGEGPGSPDQFRAFFGLRD